jgi:uncharacterized protein YjbI with pentapeptide repeats/uncharacterized protein (DUF697 family)/tellurite resistance protein
MVQDSSVQDLSGQRLRGKSFRGQDLTGANFARSDLRGANFKGTNLTGANFTGAQCGLPPVRKGLLLLGAIAAALLSGTFTFCLSHLLAYLQTSPAPSLALLLGSLGFLLLVTLRLTVEDLNQWLMRFLVILVILVSMILGGHPDWGNAVTMIALALAFTAGLTQYSAILAQLGELIAGPIESAAFIALCVAVNCAVSSNALAAGIGLGAIALGGFLGTQRNDPTIHDLAVVLSTIGGTSFNQANLTQANFSKAQLGSTDLRQAVITQTRFAQAVQLDNARVGNSILQQPNVLQLLVNLNGHRQNYRETDLSGANLHNADLSKADLTGADLSRADLSGANLEQASLIRANALSTDFRRAKFTGVCLVDWNIDVSTMLGDGDCRYLYQASQERDRLPTTGSWLPGEFTRHFTIREQDQGSIFTLETPKNGAINPQEILASLMVLVRLAIADNSLEAPEKQMLGEALQVLDLPKEITMERLLDDRTTLDELLKKINSPIIRERVYQSAYLMARVDGELETAEEELLARIQTQLAISPSKVEKLQAAVSEAQELSIAEQITAINDPEKRADAVKTNIRLMSLMHAFSGAMPIPGFAIVTHLMIYKDQVELVQKIGRIWGYPEGHKAPELNKVLFGSVGATAARVAISNVMLLVPVWGSVVGASTAFSMTWAIGELAQKFFAGEADGKTLEDEFAEAKALGQRVFQESQEMIAAKQKVVAVLVQELQADLQAGKLTQQDYMRQFRDRVGRDLED